MSKPSQLAGRKRLVHHLDTPFSAVSWPEISSNDQDVILELLCDLLRVPKAAKATTQPSVQSRPCQSCALRWTSDSIQYLNGWKSYHVMAKNPWRFQGIRTALWAAVQKSVVPVDVSWQQDDHGTRYRATQIKSVETTVGAKRAKVT
ncbi:hypothetical protein RJ55_00083 [Drechmeria coniospora]|nr:hypothetical protein RJ55_00083 [Drechmeria coniospora]